MIKLTSKCSMMCPHCMEDAQETGLMMTPGTFEQAVKFGTYIGNSHFVLSGDKPEQGMTAEEKEVEDLRKALWYIQDIKEHRFSMLFHAATVNEPTMLLRILDTTGHRAVDIAKGFNEHISKAIERLLMVGLINNGIMYCCSTPTVCLSEATQEIQQRIHEIEELRMKNEE